MNPPMRHLALIITLALGTLLSSCTTTRDPHTDKRRVVWLWEIIGAVREFASW